MYFLWIFRPKLTNADSFIWIRAEKDAIENLAGMYQEDMWGRSNGVFEVRREMKIISFMPEASVIRQILEHLNLWEKELSQDPSGRGLINEDSGVVQEPFGPVLNLIQERVGELWRVQSFFLYDMSRTRSFFLVIKRERGFRRVHNDAPKGGAWAARYYQ